MIPQCQIVGLEKIELPCPTSQVLDYICNIHNLGRYEPKVDLLKVLPFSNGKGRYLARGKFAGVPWRGEFSYRLKKDGFHSESLSKPYWVSVEAGFVVKSRKAESSELTHYENYLFPIWALPYSALIKIYLKWAMRKELRNIRNAIVPSF